MDDVLTQPVVQGRELRWLLLVLLLDRRRPMQVPELVAAVERSGFALAGRPSKAVADALRWEVERGRVAGMWNRRGMPLHPAASERARTTSM